MIGLTVMSVYFVCTVHRTILTYIKMFNIPFNVRNLIMYMILMLENDVKVDVSKH